MMHKESFKKLREIEGMLFEAVELFEENTWSSSNMARGLVCDAAEMLRETILDEAGEAMLGL